MEVLLNQEKYTTEELSYLLPFDKQTICKFAREGYLKSAKEKLQSGRVGYVYKKEDVKTFLRDNNFYPYGNIQVIDAEELVKPITKTVTNEANEEETNASSASIITGALVFKKINKFGFDFTSEKSYDENMNVAYGAMSRLAQNLKSAVTADWNSDYLNSSYTVALDWIEGIIKKLCLILTGDFPIDNYRRYLWERTKLEISMFNKQFDRGHQTYGYVSPFINSNQKGTETIKIEITDAIIR